jgi:hypothetical protein
MIHSHTNKIFLQYASPEMKILELGDQVMDIGQETQFQRSDEFYGKDGYNITTIDIHGKNRAISIDLGKESDFKFQADLLTDFGTVEHVKGLYNALKNCHNWTTVGGLMIHVNPKTGTYFGHGVSFFTIEFWEKLALAMGYYVVEVTEKSPYSDENPDVEVYAVLQKMNHTDFLEEREFDLICEGKIFGK